MTTTTEAMRLALEALEQVRKRADSANGICHLYEGDCPDPGQPDARDAGCPACKTIDASDAAIAALRAAIATSPDYRGALRELVDEFKRVFPIYYYAEPWAHDRNAVLLNAQLLLSTAPKD